MSTTTKSQYDTSGQTITCSIASVTNNSARESTVIDNSTNLYIDTVVFVKVKSGGSGTSSTGVVNVYAYGTADGGTNYPDNVTGSDAAITLVVPPNIRLIGVVNVVANSTTYKGGPFSVALASGGIMPQKWGVVIENKSGGTLDSTAGNHSVFYQGIWAQQV